MATQELSPRQLISQVKAVEYPQSLLIKALILELNGEISRKRGFPDIDGVLINGKGMLIVIRSQERLKQGSILEILNAMELLRKDIGIETLPLQAVITSYLHVCWGSVDGFFDSLIKVCEFSKGGFCEALLDKASN